jgi:hypothetical protein
MSSDIVKAIICTICYADIFNYPLNLDEIWERMVNIRCEKVAVEKSIRNIQKISAFREYFFLTGRKEIVKERIVKDIYSRKKFLLARKAAKLLQFIPTVKLIGISGTLASKNTDLNDDIDLMIVTKSNLLWSTRLFCNLTLDIFGMRRHPNDTIVKDKICMNMFLDENHLGLGKNEQNLYTAYEIIQLKPIINRDNLYERFLNENNWIKNILPNFKFNENRYWLDKNKNNSPLIMIKIEDIFKRIQLWYMKTKHRNEKYEEGVLRFHSRDTGIKILKKYENRLSVYLD